MKLIFDPNQDFRIQAIDSITSIFEGQPLDEANLSFHIVEQDKLRLISGVGNNLVLSEEQIIKNLKAIQEQNEIPVSDKFREMNFSVEI